MARFRFVAGIVLLAAAWQTASAAPNAVGEGFLPDYYASALQFESGPAQLRRKTEENGAERATYAVPGSGSLDVWRFACDRPACDAVMQRLLSSLNEQIARRIGAFEGVTPDEVRGRISAGLDDERFFAFKLPSSVLFWSLRTTDDRDRRYAVLRAAVDRQRYEDANAEGNVAMGAWSDAVLEHGRRLAARGDTAEALRVYERLLATSPANFEGHLEFAALADSAAAKESAAVVLRNAEDDELRSRAAQIAGAPEPRIEDLPPLDTGLSGLQFVFVPLAPCDVGLVEAAAVVFQRIVEAPVSVRRLPAEWTFGEPARVANQRQVQQWIVELRRAKVDFSGWSAERYAGELIAAAGGADPLTKFLARDYAPKLLTAPGQHDADFHLDRFMAALAPYRSKDRRVVYVGVTGANIYAGDSNYLFSLGGGDFPTNGGLLSYAMMLATNTGETVQSRRRVVERLAKEMAPAALKPLAVPRPRDPSDPYSYSDGVARLDEKGLMLSPQVRQALDRLR